MEANFNPKTTNVFVFPDKIAFLFCNAFLRLFGYLLAQAQEGQFRSRSHDDLEKCGFCSEFCLLFGGAGLPIESETVKWLRVLIFVFI